MIKKIAPGPSSSLVSVLRAAAASAVLMCSIGSQALASEQDAKAILRSMADYLSAQQTVEFTFDSDIEVITPAMEKIQFASSGAGVLSRPDKLRARRTGGYTDVELIFDGQTISILDHAGNAYSQIEAPGTVDQLIHTLRAGHGVALPGGDLLLTQVYDVLVADVLEAKYIGHGVIDGRECEHLAFRNLEADWQIWVEIGSRPMPCKMVITSKSVGGAPQYTLRLKEWRTGVEPAADAFAFAPPEGATMLDPNDLIHLDELPPPAAAGDGQ